MTSKIRTRSSANVVAKPAAVSALTLALALASIAAAEPGPVGLWRTAADNGEVRISECGGALCGTIVTSGRIKANPDLKDVQNKDPALRSRTLKGLSIFYGVKGGPKVWSGGNVYNPQDGHTYKGSITLVDANTLKLTGCVFGPLCQSQTWRRIPDGAGG